MKRSCQRDVEVPGKLNHEAQVLFLSLENLENQSRSKLLMEKLHKTANNMQSVNQNMNVLELCDKNSTRVKDFGIS